MFSFQKNATLIYILVYSIFDYIFKLNFQSVLYSIEIYSKILFSLQLAKLIECIICLF